MRVSAETGRRVRALLPVLVLGLIVVAAVVIRLPALRAGLPYTSYIDEFAVVDGSTHQIHHGTWDPGRYDYPTFLMSATTVVGGAFTLLAGEDLGEGARVSQASDYIYVLEPPQLIFGGRLVVLVLGVAMVAAVGLLGRELARWRVGLVAAALAGVLPAFVSRGSILITDTPAAAFTTFATLAAARIANGRSLMRWSAAAGVFGGLAFASKYTGGAALLIPVVVIVAQTQVERRRRAAAVAAVAGSALVAAAVAMPAVVLDPGAIADGISFLRRVYGEFSATDPLLVQVVRRNEVGPLALAFGLAGLVILLLRRRSRPVTVGYLAAAAPSLAVLLGSDFQPVRNVLPLLPMLCVGAAAAIDAAVTAVVGAVRRSSWPAWIPTAGVLTCGLLLVAGVALTGTRGFVADQHHYVDSRVEARRWLDAQVEPGDRVLVAEQLGFLPRELARLDAEVVVAPQQGFSADGEWDYVLAGRLQEQPFAWSVTLQGREPLAEFGHLYASCPRGMRATPEGELCPQTPVPRAWHWNDIGVLVYGPGPGGGGGG